LHYQKMAVTDDKITATVARYRKLLDKRPHAPESLAQAPDSELRVIMEAAGAKRRSPGLLGKLEAAFTEAGIVTFPALTDPFLKSTDRVCMFDARQPVDGLAEQRFLFPKRRTCRASSGRGESTLSDFVACPGSRSRQFWTADDASTFSAERQLPTSSSLSS
jgi:hypothetical protein